MAQVAYNINYDPLKIYSRELRKTRMEDLDDGTGRIVSGQHCLPRIDRLFSDVNQGRLEREARSDTQQPPSSQKGKNICCDPWGGTQRAEMDRPQVISSNFDIEMLYSPETYIQYPQEGFYQLEEIEPPLAYLMFADQAPAGIKEQPDLGIQPCVNPWDVQGNMDPPPFRGQVLPMPYPSGMLGYSSVEKPQANPPKKRGGAVKKVKIITPPKKAPAAAKKEERKKKMAA